MIFGDAMIRENVNNQLKTIVENIQSLRAVGRPMFESNLYESYSDKLEETPLVVVVSLQKCYTNPARCARNPPPCHF